MLITVLIASFLAAAADLSGLILFWKKGWAVRYSNFLVSFAAGALLGAAFLELLPEALERGGSFSVVIVGLLLFYVLERVLFLHHIHIDSTQPHGGDKVQSSSYLMLVGNTLHDFTDGIIIALTFLIDFKLGIVTTIAVVAHEFPSGIGEFSVLIHGGVKELQALLYTFLSTLATPLGALLTLVLAQKIEPLAGILISLAVGGFIYIAAVDLIPETHREFNRRRSLIQGGLLVLGILVIFLVGELLGH